MSQTINSATKEVGESCLDCGHIVTAVISSSQGGEVIECG